MEMFTKCAAPENEWCARNLNTTRTRLRAAGVLLLALCAPAFGANLFGQWMVRHGKTYTSVEE